MRLVLATNQVELSMPNVKDLLFTNNKKVTHIADENYNVQTLSYQIKANNFGTIQRVGWNLQAF
jgi:septation ring formation regulator EzrA